MPDHLYRQFKLIQLKEELVDWLINRHNVYQMELNYLNNQNFKLFHQYYQNWKIYNL